MISWISSKQIICLIFMINAYLPTLVKAIGCYKCSTTNNDSSCTDPFNPGASKRDLYEPECKSGIHDRVGLFPARYCLKVSGYIASTNQQIVIRTCTVSKLLDSDSSHSSFTLKLENGTDIQVVSGLIASCKDDGCNVASRAHNTLENLVVFISISFILNLAFMS